MSKERTVREERSIKVVLAAKIVATVIRWLRADQKNGYALLARHTSRIKADGIGLFQFDNGQYRIESPSPDETVITSEPFAADSGIWDGSSMTWDMSLFDGSKPRKDGLFEASLNHDCSFHFAEEIAKANGVTVDEVYAWANRVLQLEMKYYAKIDIPAERSLIRRILDFGAGYYSRIKRLVRRILPLLVAAAAAVAAAGCAGCWPMFEGGDDGEVEADPIEWSRVVETPLAQEGE